MGGEFVPADLAENSLAALVVNVDTVFHLAARASPWGEGPRSSSETMCSPRGDCSRLQRRRECGASSPPLRRRSSPSGATGSGLTEDSPVAARFIGHYPRTKFMAERLVLECDSPAMRCVAIRPRAVAGPDDATLLPRLARNRAERTHPASARGAPRWSRSATCAMWHGRSSPRRAPIWRRGARSMSRAARRWRSAPWWKPCAGWPICPSARSPCPSRCSSGSPGQAKRRRGSRAASRRSRGRASRATAWSQTFDLAGAKRLIGWEPRHSTDETIAFALGGTP